MPKNRIAWMPGDGIGVDVMDAARLVLDALKLDIEYVPADIGWKFWREEGSALPERTLSVLRGTNCALFGAITSKPKEEADAELRPELRGKGLSYFSPIVRLRQELDLHTNVRPCKAYSGCPLNYRDGIDIVVFRENTEGMYAGVEFHPLPAEVAAVLAKHNSKMGRFGKLPPGEVAMSCRLMTRKACASIMRQAFEYAREHQRRSVTIVEKPNVLRETGGLMLRTAREVAKSYPEIPLHEANIDAICMWLLKNPLDYDVLAAENLFGDIISDLCAQLVGGMGFAAAGNVGDGYAVFEPTHGSAPKYAGQYKVNPIATILSAKMMLDYLGESEAASRIEKAVAAVVAEGRVRTYDMGGRNSTIEMAKAIAERLG